MSRRAEAAAVLALAAALAWLAHSLATPALVGLTRDDGEYVTYAKALLAGAGYVDLANPGHPGANRYPIGFSLLLAGVLAGAADWPAELARLAWVGPVSLAAFVVMSYGVLRRLGGFPVWAALAATAATAAGHDALFFGGKVATDLPFAVLVLGTLLAADALLRREERATLGWAGMGALLAAACLVRYAGVAVALAVAVAALPAGPTARRDARWFRQRLAGALGFAVVFGPWVVYRARLGGESYGTNFTDFLPTVLADWPPRLLIAAWRFFSTGPGSLIVPAASGTAPGAAPWAVVSVAVAGVVAYGAWRGWRRPRPGETGLPALALLATGALTFIWCVAFVFLEAGLATRLLLPVAPLVWIAAARGAGAIAPDVPRWAAPAVMAGALALAGLDLAAHPRPDAAARAAIAREHLALFEAVRREVPMDAVVISRFPQMVWLYTGRTGHALPPGLENGRITPLQPFPLLLVLEHWRVGWIVTMAPLDSGYDDAAGAVEPLARAYPGILRTRWRGTDARYAVSRVEPGPFETWCEKLGVRAINAGFEARERGR